MIFMINNKYNWFDYCVVDLFSKKDGNCSNRCKVVQVVVDDKDDDMNGSKYY